jgi:hypothetical protein
VNLQLLLPPFLLLVVHLLLLSHLLILLLLVHLPYPSLEEQHLQLLARSYHVQCP